MLVAPVPSVTGMSNLSDVQAWLDEPLPLLLEKYDVPARGLGRPRRRRGRGRRRRASSTRRPGSRRPPTRSSRSARSPSSGPARWSCSWSTRARSTSTRRCAPTCRSSGSATRTAAAQITIRQLLNHTSGFEGDIFTDTGVGDDCVEKYLGVLHEVPQLFPPGEQFSYNNAGFCVLGRLVEVLREKTYDDCLREHLFAPLGLTHAATGPYDAIMFRAAMGHIELEPGAGYQPAPVWALARSNAPAGSMLSMRPRDLLDVRRDAPRRRQGRRRHPGARPGHRRPGCTAREVDLPYLGVMGTSWGLGFERFDTPDGDDHRPRRQHHRPERVPAHGPRGRRRGRAAHQRRRRHLALPRHRRPRPRRAHRRHAARRCRCRRPTRERIDASRYVGTYSAEVADLIVSQDDDGRIWIEQTPKGLFEELGEKPERKRARPLPRRQPDPARARPRHAHPARLPRRRRRRPRPVPPRRSRRPARRRLTHPTPTRTRNRP